jgi:hypothetical protein
MRIIKTLLSVLGLSVMAFAVMPLVSSRDAVQAGVWKEVCCGSLCTGGDDYCIGTGSYDCCKQ